MSITAPATNPPAPQQDAPVTAGRTFVRGLPLAIGLLLVAGVWAAGAVWSFSEQRDFAHARGFDIPFLLPLTIDGLALSLAVVAWSAALDGRAAVQARVGTFVSIGASATSNATWAYSRTGGDWVAVVLAAGVPLAAAVAFETLLVELRKGVHRRRGEEAPVLVTPPRLIRLVLAPVSTFRAWRKHVLVITAPGKPATPARPKPAAQSDPLDAIVQAATDRALNTPRRPTPGPNAAPTPARAPRQATDVGDLLLAARAVKAELDRAGQNFTRRALVDGLRARGHGCGNEKAAELMRQLEAA